MGEMEEVDVQRLPRRELLQLCADNDIRTAGVKQDDLVRLLQKKLHRPATDPSRVTTKTSSNLPISLPRGKEKSAEKTPPTPGSTTQRRSLRPLVLADDLSMQASPEASPTKNQQVSPTPSVPPRKTIATTPSTPTAQRSNLLHKNVTALTAIGKLQAQERARPGKQNDGRGRGITTAATAPGAGKQAQQSDAASVRSRSTSAPKKSIRSTSMEPVKRPGERVKRSEASRFKAQSNPKLNAAYLEAAAKRSLASAASKAVSHYGSELGSHDYDNVSEIATDAGHHEDSGDAASVTSIASEPASRFTPQTRTSKASKLGRPVSHGAHERNCSYDESCPAPKAKHSDGDNLFSQEDDTAFNLVGDADEHEINSFLNANIGPPEDITAGDDSPKTSCQEKNIVVHEENPVREHEAAGHEPSIQVIRESESVEERPKVEDANSPVEVSRLGESSTTLDDKETEDSTRSKEITLPEAEEGLKSNLNDDEESPNAAITSNTQHEHSSTHQDPNALSANDLPQDSSVASTVKSVQAILDTHQDSIALSTNDSPQESSIAYTAKSMHSILDTAPVPHPNMERSQITPMSVDSPPTPDELGEQEPAVKTLRSPCDELQQEFKIKLRRDYNKDANKSNVLEDRSVKVPLLQQGREAESTLLARRSFPSSILLWCSQLFAAIFGTRSQRC